MDSVFLGKEGLTSTSANFYANIAQEIIQAAQERLNNVKFFQVSVASLDSEQKLMSVGQNSLDFIKQDLEKIATMNSFCAWIREAIKAKDNLLDEVDNTLFDEWAEKNGAPKPPTFPPAIVTISESDIIESWDDTKRNKYLQLEAFAATYGKFIHPKGIFSNARKEVHTISNCPICTEGSGRDLVLYYRQPTINVENVDNLFMELQDIYRSYEQKLNLLKTEIKEELNKSLNTQEQEYREGIANYNAAYDKYASELNELRSRFNSWKTTEHERIAALRIILPNNLLDIFSEIKKHCSE